MAITVDPDDNSYTKGFLKIEDERIVSNEFEYTVGGGNNTRTGTMSDDPIGYKGSKNEYSWSASDIPMEYKSLFMKYKLNKKTFPIHVFNFGTVGDYHQEGTLLHCRVEEVTVNVSDEGFALDVSGIALGFEDAK